MDSTKALTPKALAAARSVLMAAQPEEGGLISTRLIERMILAALSEQGEAAHSCGNGHLACCTKRHLSWKTRAENEGDKLVHGTHNRGEQSGRAKLTEASVREIYALKGKRPQRDLAAQFGVSQTTVKDIQRGRCWKWLVQEMG